MKTVAPDSNAQGHIGKAMAVVWDQQNTPGFLELTHDVCSPPEVDVLGEHGSQVDSPGDGISSNINSKLSNEEREGYSSAQTKHKLSSSAYKQRRQLL